MKAILMWGSLAIVVGVSLFLLKYKVQGLETELAEKREHITRDRSAIRVLEAEWTYLNSPERLRHLSAQYLGFGAPKPQNVIDISGLPLRAAPDAAPDANAPASGAAPSAALPQIADAQSPASQSLSVMPVFARLQRFLLPGAAEVSSSSGAAHKVSAGVPEAAR